jgi:hypothetical protein
LGQSAFPAGERPEIAPGLGWTLARDARRVKVSEEAKTAHKTAHKRIEITIQTDQTLTIRRGACARMWCQQCGCEVDVVEAEILSCKGKVLDARDGTRQWHYFEGPDGTTRVCLESLLKG